MTTHTSLPAEIHYSMLKFVGVGWWVRGWDILIVGPCPASTTQTPPSVSNPAARRSAAAVRAPPLVCRLVSSGRARSRAAASGTGAAVAATSWMRSRSPEIKHEILILCSDLYCVIATYSCCVLCTGPSTRYCVRGQSWLACHGKYGHSKV